MTKRRRDEQKTSGTVDTQVKQCQISAVTCLRECHVRENQTFILLSKEPESQNRQSNSSRHFIHGILLLSKHTDGWPKKKAPKALLSFSASPADVTLKYPPPLHHLPEGDRTLKLL